MGIARTVFLATAMSCAAATAGAVDSSQLEAVHEEDGKFFTADGTPTFMVLEDGTVDWYTFSGFRRYHAECHVCHGPDGQGSSYAPGIARSTMEMDYWDFLAVVAGGRERGNSVMPALGTNRNVMCYIDDIFIYLRAVGSGAIPRGRPAKRMDRPDSFVEHENDCMG